MAEPKDQGGLEYLVKAGKLPSVGEDKAGDSSSSAAEPVDNRNLQAFAAPTVLSTIKELESARAPGAGVRLSEVADRIGRGADVLIPLARQLAGAGVLEVIESSTFGDELVALTPEGTRLLDEGATRELIERIAAS